MRAVLMRKFRAQPAKLVFHATWDVISDGAYFCGCIPVGASMGLVHLAAPG